MKDCKIDRLSPNYLTVDLLITEYNCDMNDRIAQFERVWNTRLLPPPRLVRMVQPDPDEFPREELRRQTNRHHLLPPDLEQRWWTATADEKENIMFQFEMTR